MGRIIAAAAPWRYHVRVRTSAGNGTRRLGGFAGSDQSGDIVSRPPVMELSRRRKLEPHRVVGEERHAVQVRRERSRTGDEEREDRERIAHLDQREIGTDAGPIEVPGQPRQPIVERPV